VKPFDTIALAPGERYTPIVLRFRVIFLLSLLLLWLPATSYCLLENTGLICPGGCCEHEDYQNSKGATKDCDRGCGIVDAVGIHKKSPTPARQVWIRELVAVCLPKSCRLAGPALRWSVGESPPDSLRLAVLRARTSLPTRGPSLAV